MLNPSVASCRRENCADSAAFAFQCHDHAAELFQTVKVSSQKVR